MQRERSSQHRGILLKSLFLMPGWCSNTLHTYRAVVSTASRLHKFCITQFIAHFPSATLFRGTEQQVSWSFNCRVFSQRRLAADYNVDAGGVILLGKTCCWKGSTRLPLEGQAESHIADSQPQTDEVLWENESIFLPSLPLYPV